MEKKEISISWVQTKDGEKLPTLEAILNLADCIEIIAQDFTSFVKTSGRDINDIKNKILSLESRLNEVNKNDDTKVSVNETEIKHLKGRDAKSEVIGSSIIEIQNISKYIEDIELKQKMLEQDIIDLKDKLDKSIDLLYQIQESIPSIKITNGAIISDHKVQGSNDQILVLENQLSQINKTQLETLRYTKAAVEGIKKLLEHY